MTPSVAYVLTHHPRLAQTFIAREIEGLERQGWKVERLSMNAALASDLDSETGRAEQAKTFYIKTSSPATVIAAVARASTRAPLRFGRLAARAARTGGTDIKAIVWRLFQLVEACVVWDHCRRTDARHLHAHFGQTPATIAWFAAEVGNLAGRDHWTWSFTSHGFQDFVNETDARLDLKAASASFVVCVSDFTRSQLMRVSDPAYWNRLEVVRCGIDLAAFTQRQPRPVPAVPRILIVARISPEKGHVVLLDAVAQLRGRGIDCTVEVVGGGDFLGSVRDEAHRLGIAERVEFLGELEPSRVIERLEAADIFCLPSFAEGLPVSIMEAMAIGVPVVSTYISGIPELAEDHRTALTVAAGSSVALADAIAELVDDSELAPRLVTAARAAVEAHHSIELNVAMLAKLFESVGSSEVTHVVS